MTSRWRCVLCFSTRVQISYPAWYYEDTAYDLKFINTDEDADPLYWYCEECGAADSGHPTLNSPTE
jgi:hypothetical protein